jgi:large subunit ribosomal protein L25
MAEISIKGARRSEFGKGASRRIRKAGQVPAVIYGHGTNPLHISLPAKDVMQAIKTSNVLLDIDIEGQVELTLPKSIVRNPLKGYLEHIDLLLVRRDERVKVFVPVHAEGEYDRDGILEHVHNSIEVECLAISIPQFLQLDITGLTAGNSKTAGDVKLPDGVSLVSAPDMTVVHLSVRAAVEETPVAAPAAEGEAAEAAAPAAEGEAEKK